MPDDTNKPTANQTDQSSQEIHGNQQNISGEAEITGPVVGGDVEQIGDRTITTTTTTTTTTTNIFNLFPQLTRRQWTYTGLALLVLLLGLAAYATRARWLPQEHCPADKTCLLIAAFGPASEAKAAEVSAALETNIHSVLAAAEATGDVAIVSSRPVAGEPEAQALAATEGALLVIWGHYFVSENRTQIFFELSDRLGVGESGQVRPYRAEPLRYNPVVKAVECTDDCTGIAGEVTRRTQAIAWFALGLVHYASGQPEIAEKEFQAALYCAGEEVERARLPDTLPACTPITDSTPAESALIRYYLGKTYVLQGDYRQGIEHLTTAAQANPNDPAAWLAIGEAATNWYGDALADPPLAADAFDQAEQAARALSAARDGTVRAFTLGLIDELQGDPAGAIVEYQKAVDSFAAEDSGAYVSLLALARVQAAAGESSLAEENLRKASELQPDAPWAYLELARLLAADTPAAEELLGKAGEAAPNQAYVSIVRGDLCAGWGDRVCAGAAYAQALEMRPDSGWLHSRVGDFYLPSASPVAGQSWEEAEIHYRRAVELRPADPWVHQRLGYVLLNLPRNEEAAAAYTAALELFPDDLPPGALDCTLALAQERAGLPVTADCP